jgi:hypothetical protein
MWKNKNAVNNALKNYFNTHVIPELIQASSPSLKNVAKKSVNVTRRKRSVSRAALEKWRNQSAFQSARRNFYKRAA